MLTCVRDPFREGPHPSGPITNSYVGSFGCLLEATGVFGQTSGGIRAEFASVATGKYGLVTTQFWIFVGEYGKD